MNIISYTISHLNLDHKKLLSPWEWLIGNDKEIIVITKMGDVLLTDPEGKLYLLSTTDGTLELISNYATDFFKNRLSADDYYEIFQPMLIKDLEDHEKQLKDGQVYAYKTLPVDEKQISVSNIHSVDIYKYFLFAATIHKQINMVDPE